LYRGAPLKIKGAWCLGRRKGHVWIVRVYVKKCGGPRHFRTRRRSTYEGRGSESFQRKTGSGMGDRKSTGGTLRAGRGEICEKRDSSILEGERGNPPSRSGNRSKKTLKQPREGGGRSGRWTGSWNIVGASVEVGGGNRKGDLAKRSDGKSHISWSSHERKGTRRARLIGQVGGKGFVCFTTHGRIVKTSGEISLRRARMVTNHRMSQR